MAASRSQYTRVYDIVRPPVTGKPFNNNVKALAEHQFDFITTSRLATVQHVHRGFIEQDAPADTPTRLIYIDKGARVQSRWNSVWIQTAKDQYPLYLCGQFGEARLEGLYLYSRKDGLTQMTTLDLPGAGIRGELHDM
jgi:hypothetical protein